MQAYDLYPRARSVAASAGFVVKDSVSDNAKDVDFVVTCLPATQDVDDTLNMEGGIFDSVNKGTYICDVSTILPKASIKFA